MISTFGPAPGDPLPDRPGRRSCRAAGPARRGGRAPRGTGSGSVAASSPALHAQQALATAQPSSTSPTTFSARVRAPSKNTSLNSQLARSSCGSGRTSTPGWSSGTSRKEMPRCLGASGSVRASTKIQFAVVGAGGPDLLAVDHPLVAVAHRARLQRGRGPSRRPARSSPGTRCPRRRGCGAGSGASAPPCPSAAACSPSIFTPKVSLRHAERHAGQGELLDQDDLLELGQARPAVLRRARSGRGSRARRSVAPPVAGEGPGRLLVERADALPVRRAGARRGTP